MQVKMVRVEQKPCRVRWSGRLVSVTRGEDGSFGFMLSGQDPVRVKSVMSGSAAQKAGITAGDAVLQVNGVDVRSVCLCGGY